MTLAPKKVLVTGSTGYVGGRLVTRLLAEGHAVRVLVRNRNRITGRAWAGQVEVAEGDLLEAQSLGPAFEGIEAAYYLVHSMLSGSAFAEKDRLAARNFAQAATRVPKVIYLGGLSPAKGASNHLKSRTEVGEILRATLPVTEFRAGPIIGSGSASFEMIRYLTERLPIMVAPKWVGNEIEPVAIRDVLEYLVAALGVAPAGVLEIGGDRLTFKQMMEVYAEVRRLKRVIVPVPVLAPHLASLWVGLVTPIPNSLAVPLIGGIVRPLIADSRKSRELFPLIEPTSYRKAVELALARIRTGEVETRWSGSLGRKEETYLVADQEGLIREVRRAWVWASPDAVFRAFSSLGGGHGWLVWNWAWRLRGALDRWVGGPGLRRGRRDPLVALPGEAIDFWRVEAAERPALLRLRAEMKLPGRAWLQWETLPENGGTLLTQTAIFAPKGLFGLIYWYALYPIHRRVFSDMIRALSDASREPGG